MAQNAAPDKGSKGNPIEMFKAKTKDEGGQLIVEDALFDDGDLLVRAWRKASGATVVIDKTTAVDLAHWLLRWAGEEVPQ